MIKNWLNGSKIVIENNRNIIIIIFFAILLLIGLGIFRDYGVGWDEKNNRNYGIITIDHISHINLQAKYQATSGSLEFWDPVSGQFAKSHGPVFEVLLVSIERVLNLDNIREILLLRHIAGFLIFYVGVLFFYLLCKHIFRSWKIGLLGSLFLALSPRIFAYSFHNSVDIPFLSMFIVSMYTLIKYLEKKNIRYAFLHAISCALMIDIRIAGIVIPLITFIFVILDIIVSGSPKAEIKKIIPTLFVYILVLSFFVVLLWPMLWENPIKNFISAFKLTANDPWGKWELYFGEKVRGREVPWHFTPAWMSITTPPIYTFCFLIGLFSLIRSIRKLKNFYLKRMTELIAMLCFFLPLVAVALLRSTLFNGWRHMFFIYPGFLILSLRGVLSILGFIKKRIKGVGYDIITCIFVLIIISSMLSTAFFMIRSHPHQTVYFNGLIGGLQNAKGKFQMGPWGTEYREGLEYILENDPSGDIKIWLSDMHKALRPVEFNAKILELPDRDRLQFVKDLNEADYFLTNYCSHIPDYSSHFTKYSFTEIWSRKIGGIKILTVYTIENITEREKSEQELKGKMEELEKMNKIMVGREMRVIELKKEIDLLLKESGREPRYGQA